MDSRKVAWPIVYCEICEEHTTPLPDKSCAWCDTNLALELYKQYEANQREQHE